MKREVWLSRYTPHKLSVMWGMILVMLLLLSLAGCGNAETQSSTQAAIPDANGTRIPQSTRSASRYATRTPPSGPPQASPTLVKTVDIPAEELAGQIITFWHPWQGQAATTLQAIVDEYNRTNPWGVNVEIHAFDSFTDLEDAYLTSTATGDSPSLLVAYDDRAQYWDQGGQELANLQAYMGDPVWGLTAEEMADFYPAFWQQGVSYSRDSSGNVTSKQLSLPLHRSEQVLYYNQSMAVELGYKDIPITPSQLRNQVCKAARERGSVENDGTGGLLLSTLPSSTPGREIILQPEQWLGWIGSFGGQVSLPEGAGYQFNTPEALRALGFLKELHQEGCVLLSDSSTPADEFASRRGLIYLASSAELPTIQAAFSAVNSQDQWIMLPFPSAAGAAGTVAYGPSLVMPQADSLQQLAAWTLLEWLVSPQNQARWAQAVAAYPVRVSASEFLDSAITSDPLWVMGLELLPDALAEPPIASWSVVRWLMADALTELFSGTFTTEQIPVLLEDLDSLAAEVDNQWR